MENFGQHLRSLLENPTPPRSTVKSEYLRKCMNSESIKKGLKFEDSNISLTLNPSSLKFEDSTISVLNPSKDPSLSVTGQYNESSLRMSGLFELDNSRFEAVGFQDDTTNMIKKEYDTTVVLDTESGTSIMDSLFEEFLDFFTSYSGEHEIYNLLSNYEELCCKQIKKLQEIRSKTTETKFSKTVKMLRFLQEERNTWRLLRILFQDRLNAENIEDGDILMETVGKKLSDQQIINLLYEKNSYIRQNQLIIDWLERNAADDFESMFSYSFDYFTDNCLALEHSLNELTTNLINKNHKGFPDAMMDPDANLRLQKDFLHETDKENEARLFKYMFLCLRAGNLEKAQQLAKNFGDPWLAAALEGWKLHHDPNYEEENPIEGQELLSIEGNKYRDLWKASCWQICQSPDVPVYEQALFGTLCGNLKAMLSSCHTWEDYLWSYFKSSLDKLIEQEIRDNTQSERTLEDMPVDYWDKILDVEEIFQELESNQSEEIQSGSKSVLHIIQKYIILGNLDGLIEEMYSWLSKRKLDAHVLRVMVHLILFLRIIGQCSKDELCVPILEAYVKELIRANKVSLVALYTSTLPKEQQIIWYAKFLEGIKNNVERQRCLQYADEAGLDIPQITKRVVKNVREKEPEKSESHTDLSAITTKDDEEKIQAIDWLIFDPTQRAEAVKQANALMRLFIAQRKIEAAKQLFGKIPSDSLAIMMQLSKTKGMDELSAEDDNAAREYLCFKAYLEAMDAFNEWFHHSIHSKPKEPVSPSGESVTFKEKVAHEHEMQQYERDLERWHEVVAMLGKTASECLYNVLLFVDGGWMVDQRGEDTINENRQKQLSQLRQLCLPHVTRLLQDLLLSENMYKETIQLADIISSERYHLFKEFTPDDIENFLRVSLDASFALLDKNLDPLGYKYQEEK
ncbi:nuclear pore complex protein Nup107-like [Uloborus diversus]|uniref:nuclear pore complex protein Nup107-like n=1 Tax=Uloborus diversus TaxID=327109 RepID=UPI0024091989|nr:nuclear pore complex protein Nup107-like [Uloborus diversus]